MGMDNNNEQTDPFRIEFSVAPALGGQFSYSVAVVGGASGTAPSAVEASICVARAILSLVRSVQAARKGSALAVRHAKQVASYFPTLASASAEPDKGAK